MKRNNTFKKWIALFLSVAMVAVSGVTTNTSMSAAESTGVQESAAADTTDGTAAADADASSAASSANEDDTSKTQEIALQDDGTTADTTEDEETEPAKTTEPTVTDSTAASSTSSDSSVESTSSTSESSSDEVLSEDEQIDKAREDATKRTYSYDDANISVNAVLDDPKAIPDNAEFRVTPITQNTIGYNYNAYMNALNDDAAASSDSDTEKKYTDENTLLYDMAFIYKIDVQNDDGTTSQKEVEVQPAEGAVKMSVDFKKNQLTDDLSAESDSDIEIKHLPLTDSVRESTDTTADATNIAASDVKVEDVKNADVSVDSQTAEFKADSFSVFSFNTNQPSDTYCWNYKENEGTTFSYGEVLNKINANDNTTNYAIYANSLTSAQHLEGNIKVGTLDITGNQQLNQDSHVVERNAVTTVQVTKKLSQKSDKDQTFNFASYDSNNNQIETFSITIKAGETSGVKVLENASATVGKLASEDVTIYELDSKGNPVANNGKNDDYVVTYGNNVIASIKSESNSDSYIGSVKQSIEGTLSQKYFQGDINATTYIENFTNGRFDGNNYVFTSDGTVTLQDYYNIDSNVQKIKQQSGITSAVATNLNHIKAVSKELANAHMGVNAGQGSLSVINIKCVKPEKDTSTEGYLESDLNKVLHEVQNGTGIINTVNEDGYLLINIDATGMSKYYLQQINIDGYNADNNNEELARHIIYNIVQKDSSGQYEPYTGTVTTQNVAAGIVLAPAAKYINEGGLRGEVIADSCDRSGGAEIHKDSLTTQTTRKVEITNTSSAEGHTDFTFTKAISGRSFKAGDKWTFTVSSEDPDAPLPKETSVTIQPTKGTTTPVEFGDVNYDLDDVGKTYTYTVSESGKVTGVQNAASQSFTVTVTDKGDGTLNVVNSSKATPLTFTNTYTANGTLNLSVTKKLVGRDFKAGDEWTFRLTGEDGAPMPEGQGNVVKTTEVRGESQTLRFGDINYTEADVGKEYQYQIKETGSVEGVVNDPDDTLNVKVKVTENGDGSVVATPEYDNNNDQTFTNTYEAQDASAVISGTKTLNGVPASVAGQFRFDLFDANGKNRIDTAANDKNGNFIFGRLHFEKAGDYTYTIKEQNAGEIIDGIRYQDAARTVTITVKDDGNGHLVANNARAAAFDNEKYGTITVGKNWNDAGNEKYRPSTVVVDLIDAATGETVQKAELSEVNNWTATFDQLVPGGRYTVHEDENSEYYAAENNDQVVTADANGTQVTLVNDFVQPTVTIYANKVLNGGTLANGEFTFNLYRNSDPDTVVKTATNNASGEIFFTDIAYDAKGYTVREAAGDDDSIAYDSEAIVYDAKGNITSDHREFTNTQRPIVLRVQKRSKEAPYDPLVGATYGLYQVVEGGNDILVESEISDENGYMYYGRIQPGVIYYFKEIAAPAGHEVDPYPGQKFQVKYTSNGQIALYDENGNPTTVGDITGQDSKNLLVQYTTEKTAVDTSSSLSYSDDSIVAVAKADNSKAFAAGTKLKVTQLSGSEAKTAAAAVEAACGKINSNIAYYDIQFIDASGNEVEPAGGDVTVTIQYKGNLDLPEGTDRTALKLVHLTKEANGETTVEAVPGTVAADQDGLLQTSFTADSFSTFGVVEPGSDNTLGQNYLVTAAGVADQVSELKVAKLDTAGKYIKGAKLQIIEKATGNVMAEWNTADGPQSFARWFDDAKTVPMNVDTYYILHEVSAPDGYQLADDILFMINKYDSSITVYKYDDNGKLVIDQEAIDKWVSDTTLQMIDVPVKHETVTLVKQKLVPNEKTIQGEDKIVHVTSIQAVRTGDTTPIALFVILLAAAAVVLLILVYRGRKKKDS